MNNEFFEKLKERVRPYFEDGGSHEFSHTERVLKMAIKLAKNENIDLDVLKTAAILHDIARAKQDRREVECHAEEGAKIAEQILKELNFPKEKINKVVHAIEVHRDSKKLKAETREAEILQDADRLDALGAITIARMFSTGGKINIPLHNPNFLPEDYKGYSNTVINGFNMKILKIKPETFNTKQAKEIAKERYDFVTQFLDRFLKEWEGKA